MESQESQLYAVTALFDTPDDIIHAAEMTSAAGYRRYDVNTPYPVHGMDGAMKLKSSSFGYFALAFGIFGAVSAVAFMSWVTLSDYPLVIGGKPFWSWPAFVPVAFELTVLAAAVLSIVAMIIVLFKFPNNSHPLHDTQYMKSVSSDKFGINIQADDVLFEEQKVRDFLASLGGKDVAPIYYDSESDAPKLFEWRFMAVLLAAAVIVSGTTYAVFNKVLYMSPFNWMMEQPKLNPQKPSSLFVDGKGMRPPVEGTIARGFIPYPYAGNPDDAGKYLVNSTVPTREVLAKGKEKFLTFCSPCHGNFGRGDSRLRGQFPNPPTLHSDKVRNWPDGNIYHVITVGQNVMPSYASQISRDDRWAVVRYVRVLQRAHNAKESDVQ
ncbi:MAG: DUF3341 domain-containing protein [Ignavibacteriales bacterium]|nr:DUF3341 domain-containing protein [Ignavibacteriales bacterium]